VIEFGRMKVSKLRGSLLTAVSAYHSSKFP
jgi:hypothetical protein